MRALKNWLSRQHLNFNALRYLLKYEFTFKTKKNLFYRLRCLSSGFTSEKPDIYNWESFKDRHKYLSDFARYKTQSINNIYSVVINDKFLFEQVMIPHKLTAQMLGMILKGRIYLAEKEATSDDFLKLLIKERHLLLKHNKGGGDEDIIYLKMEGDQIFLNNGKISDTKLIEKIAQLTTYQICEYLFPAEYSAKIYPNTLNTIRVITMRDPKTGEIFIPIAIHKFGSRLTEPVDNFHRGGVTALIDLETGILQKAVQPKNHNKAITWIYHHPDTDALITGIEVQDWVKAKESVIKLASSFTYLSYVGWDIALTNKGLRVIEGNNFSDVNLLQIHQPLLINQRAQNFYRYHKIIK